MNWDTVAQSPTTLDSLAKWYQVVVSIRVRYEA